MEFTIKGLFEIGIGIGIIITGIVLTLKRNKIIRLPKGFKRDIKIHDMLVEIRTETKSDRVQVCLFHNGEFYENENSILKFTCAYEVVKEGVERWSPRMISRLVTHYMGGIKKFVNSKNRITRVNASELDNGEYKSMMIASGADLHVGIPLVWRNRIIGFLLVVYMHKKPTEECLFKAMVEEGHTFNTDTSEFEKKVCTGTCSECRLGKFITRLETELANKK